MLSLILVGKPGIKDGLRNPQPAPAGSAKATQVRGKGEDPGSGIA
jgi:hypothetical protein